MDGGGFLNCSKIRPSCYVFEFTSLNSRYKLVVESLYGPCLEVEVKFLLGYQICKTCKWFLAWLFMKLQKSLSEQIVSKDMSNQFWIVAIWEKSFKNFTKQYFWIQWGGVDFTKKCLFWFTIKNLSARLTLFIRRWEFLFMSIQPYLNITTKLPNFPEHQGFLSLKTFLFSEKT